MPIPPLFRRRHDPFFATEAAARRVLLALPILVSACFDEAQPVQGEPADTTDASTTTGLTDPPPTTSGLATGGETGSEETTSEERTTGETTTAEATTTSATSDPMTSGDSSSSSSGSPDECPANNAGNTVPLVVGDNTVGRSNDLAGSCGDGDEAPELGTAFTAPQAGVYFINTEGSDFDTVVYVLDGGDCSGVELACRDDGPFTEPAAWLVLELDADQDIVVVVDGSGSGEEGNYLLSIDLVESEVDCCTLNNGVVGCNDNDTMLCVCEADLFCCGWGWDQMCVDQVESLGCGTCE